MRPTTHMLLNRYTKTPKFSASGAMKIVRFINNVNNSSPIVGRWAYSTYLNSIGTLYSPLGNTSPNKGVAPYRFLHTSRTSQYLYFYGKTNDLSGARAPAELDFKLYSLFLFRVVDGEGSCTQEPVVLDQGSLDKELSKGLLGWANKDPHRFAYGVQSELGENLLIVGDTTSTASLVNGASRSFKGVSDHTFSGEYSLVPAAKSTHKITFSNQTFPNKFIGDLGFDFEVWSHKKGTPVAREPLRSSEANDGESFKKSTSGVLFQALQKLAIAGVVGSVTTLGMSDVALAAGSYEEAMEQWESAKKALLNEKNNLWNPNKPTEEYQAATERWLEVCKNPPKPEDFVKPENGLVIPEGKSVDVSVEEGKHSAAPTAAGTPRGDESPRTTATGREFQERLAKLDGGNAAGDAVVETPPGVPPNHVVEPAPINLPTTWYDWAMGNNLTDAQQGTRYFVLWSGVIVIGIVGTLLYSSYFSADTIAGAGALEKAPTASVEKSAESVSAGPATPLERLELLKELARAKMGAVKGVLSEKVNLVRELPAKAADAAKGLVEYLRGAGVETWTKVATAITGISSALKAWFGSKAPGLASEISKLVSGQQTLGQAVRGLGVSVIKNTAVLAKSLVSEASKLSLMAKTSLDKLSKAASDRALDAWNAAKGVAEKVGVGGAAAAAASAASRARNTALEALGIDPDWLRGVVKFIKGAVKPLVVVGIMYFAWPLLCWLYIAGKGAKAWADFKGRTRSLNEETDKKDV